MKCLPFWKGIMLSAALSFTYLNSHAQAFLDIEGGLVTGTRYNKVRILNQGGTLFNLAEDLRVQPQLFYRLRAGITLGGRHTITALYAPLTVRYEGAFPRDVNYNNVIFPSGQPITADYTFNSYRLTYRYHVIDRPRFDLGLGLTAKIRDANIALRTENGALETNYDNVGFVPLINFWLQYKPTDRLSVLLEGDALGAKQGRAEDVFLGLTYGLTQNLRLKGGYRVVEGGADVSDVYNMNWINYASVGVVIGRWK
ncbi:hypothetical protein F5984_20385 [Rudanella paleaurantiibacter]|uniref:Outer membrane beta-barrel protein n=1 Tax=Rudanella paleaurantiibacter TaxID=2614655 RepID=A0A7J5TVD0_9BACT|nr:hypothetical protein [Rudanella paleaurantiibacter]KAB7728110.1 hypothetical protein F5984_20385 [Rudanella paleaurantiibacter]